MSNVKIASRIFKTQIQKYFKEILIIFLFVVITAAMTAVTAWLLDPAIKKIFIEKNETMLVVIPIAIIATFLIKSLAIFIVRMTTIKVAFKVLKNIQVLMTSKILISDLSHLIEKHSGKFISNFANDTRVLLGTIMAFSLSLVKESFTLIALLGVMFYQDWQLSLVAIIMIPIAAFASKSIGKKMQKAASENLDAYGNFTKFLSEILKGTSVIQIYQREQEELKKFSDVIDTRLKKEKKVEQTRHRAGPIMETINAFAIALVILFAGYRSIQGAMEIGQFVSFLTALMMAYQPVKALAGINLGIQEGLTAAKRIYEIIDQKNEVYQDDKLEKLKITNGEIQLKNISFNYPDGTKALENLTLEIKGKTSAALVGLSGGGKSTILNLIPRFYNLKEGEINIDNQNINYVQLKSLREKISLVSQDIVLFDDTIKANISFGNISATEEEIIEAAKKAAAHEFIESLKDGYDTVIGEAGIKLSGGQKQRLSIARAILKNSPIILLDEATSALDTESESLVQKAIENLISDKTTIIIAHRLSTIKNVNKIFVIDNGRVAEQGSHEELISNSIIYKKLYDQQNLNS
ncbi:MAG: ABC transporter transmembrane domain-containing protein [Pelagibacteraceae bacterium]|nr:ABC transporter transmembrane domain-containing protein [Pelagibacteraceae bacterium]MCI5079574.1 ABC transporter transmembrane domain-containing protein [Pelagibacteraceae bacterium]